MTVHWEQSSGLPYDNTLKNTYDYRNRLTEQAAKERKTGKETKHSYTYNAYGNAATQDDTAFVYDDASGQVTKETTKLTKHKDIIKTYTYDSAGNKTAFAVKVGDDTKLSLKYTYDGESRLTSVTDEAGNEIAGYTYDTDGNLAERTVAGNNLKSTYTYDYQNHLTQLKNQTNSAGIISEYNSEYLANGQKSKETSDTIDKNGKKSTKTATYTYDLLGRIKKETKTGREDISYTYDSNNNRKGMRAGNKVTAYKYNKNDELLRTDTLNTDTEKDNVVIYKNDKNGNQLATVNRYEIPSDKKDSAYVDIDVTLGDNRLNENVVNHYNALNQLTRTLTKNYKVSFVYDTEGLRTSKTVNGERTVFVWDGDQLVMELSEGGKVKKRYIRGNDLILSDKGTENASGKASEKQYYVTDSHGNVVQLADKTGNVIKTYEYDSFGNEIKPDRKDDNPFRYCGEYYDKETEEIYLRARYYQPKAGRFLTKDTYTGEEDEPESLHLYAYCENDGVNMTDPTGHDAIWLQQTDGAMGFGHTAVCIQKREKERWCYFSFASSEPNNIFGNINGIKGKMITQSYNVDYTQKWKGYPTPKGYSKKLRKEFEDGISSIKAAQTLEKRDGVTYDKCIYLKGDFIRGYKFLTNKKRKIEKGKAKNYKLFSNNCKNTVVNALKKGTYIPPRTKEFKECLKKAKKKLIPNSAYKIVQDFIFSYPRIVPVKNN